MSLGIRQSAAGLGPITNGMPLDLEKIRRLREKLKITQAEAGQRARLAEELKHCRQRWNEIEKGHRKNLTLDVLERVAHALGVKAKDLLI